MFRTKWNAPGSRYYNAGVDRGMAYRKSNEQTYNQGEPWNGLVSVRQQRIGGAEKPLYQDGIKRTEYHDAAEFAATIDAFTYPNRIEQAMGDRQVAGGLTAFGQATSEFGFSYRSAIGNDIEGQDHAYLIHFIYNCTIVPTQPTHSSLTAQSSASLMSFNLNTRVVQTAGMYPTAYLFLDSRRVSSQVLESVEKILYGFTANPRMPGINELIQLMNSGPQGFYPSNTIYPANNLYPGNPGA